ncbi:MAG: hypothetical protein DHS20C18_20710 [Saprospiraceae bacterium]|nr:MAG: hypothetical protein DHS20C18_20710 [Saprospiraceae bacterium]
MLIANPIYDAVFKYLMEDKEIARELLSLIIKEEIVEIEFKPQEQTGLADKFSVTIFRLDFRAIIKTKTGELKKVLIELQKGRHLIDIQRFRRYLGENYVQEDEIVYGQKDKVRQILPIITIYLLGFKLKGVDTPALKVNRTYRDLITGKVLYQVKHPFVESLTHDCYVIQIPRLDPSLRNRLEKVLSVFNQHFIMGEDAHLLGIPFEPADALLEKMIKRLAIAASDKEVRNKLILEEEFEYTIERALRQKDEILERKDLEIEKILEEKSKTLQEKDRTLEEKDRTLEEKNRTLEEKDRLIEELKRKLEDRNL